MCATCGCAGETGHSHDDGTGHSHGRTVTLEAKVLARNDELAGRNRDWLAGRAEKAVRDPRLGETLFRAKLALTLDTAFDPTDLLARAEADLDLVSQEITELAGRMAGTSVPDAETVRSVLFELAADAPDEPDPGAKPRSRHGLIRALSTGDPLEDRVGHRLARSRQVLAPRHEVDVGRPDDRDPRRHGPDHTRAISAASRQLRRTISRLTSTLRRPVCSWM